jgi:hypothetical protein
VGRSPSWLIRIGLERKAMAKQRHIGFVIFGICSALSARLAVFEPKPHVPTPAEERWGTPYRDEGDTLHLIRGFRYYIYGLGVIGLLMVVEDFISGRSRKKQQPNSALEPAATASSASSARSVPGIHPPTTLPSGGCG